MDASFLSKTLGGFKKNLYLYIINHFEFFLQWKPYIINYSDVERLGLFEVRNNFHLQ